MEGQTERPLDYCISGYCPVELNQTINTYIIIHKLDNGVSATVWLAANNLYGLTSLSRFVAIPISRASETLIESNTNCTHRFYTRSINGRHECFVQPVFRPNLTHVGLGPMSAEVRLRIAAQLVDELNKLHRCRIVQVVSDELFSTQYPLLRSVADFTLLDLQPDNVVLGLLDSSITTAVDIYDRLGEPEFIDAKEAEWDNGGWYVPRDGK